MRKRGKAQRKQRATGFCVPSGDKDCVLFPHPLPCTHQPTSASLRKIHPTERILDEAEHLPHNRNASVASLR
jgi:hypothetical protein